MINPLALGGALPILPAPRGFPVTTAHPDGAPWSSTALLWHQSGLLHTLSTCTVATCGEALPRNMDREKQ